MTPVTADATSKTGVASETPSAATLTATLEESEEELLKVSLKSNKRGKLIDEE